MAHIRDNDILKNKKVQIDYPTKWGYKVIGKNKEDILKDLENILGHKTYEAKHSNTSSFKKYISLEVSVLVVSESERVAIFELLKTSLLVDYVL